MFMNIFDTILLLVIAASTAYIAYHYYRMDQLQAVRCALRESPCGSTGDVASSFSKLSPRRDISRLALRSCRLPVPGSGGAILPPHAPIRPSLTTGKALYPGFEACGQTNEQLKSQSLARSAMSATRSPWKNSKQPSAGRSASSTE